MANLKDLIVSGPARFLNKIYGNLEGNAATATKLATARTINGTSFDGSSDIITANWGTSRTLTIGNAGKSVNGSVNIAWTLSEMGAVNKAGDTMTGALNFANGTWNTMGDDAYIGDYNQAGMIGIKGKNGATGLYFAPYSGSTAQSIAINGSGTMTITGTVSGTFSGSLSGNASSATKLATARTINGTNFDGSVSITTANWGTSRTLTIGKAGKSVNGSENVNWNLQEIGANSLDGSTYSIYLTGGDGNTTGYRLIGTSSIGAWNNKRISFIVSSRHTGNGLITISYGCNNGTVSAAGCYCTIRYFGASKKDSQGPISSDSFFAYVNSSGNTMYFFWKYHDYNSTYITILNNNSDLTISNGTWMTSISTSTYGNQIATVDINMSDAVYDSGNNNKITFSYSKSALSSTSWFAAWDGYELKTISPSNTRNTIGAMAAINANGYYGMGTPSGGTSDWIRTTTNGIIPYQSGGSSSLGTSSWPFINAYINTIYGNLSGNASTATNADKLDNKHANEFIYFSYDTGLGNGSPADTAKSYFIDDEKTPRGMIKGYYNHNGAEYSQLYSRALSGSYGSILKWGYSDRYIRILRYYANSWKSEDWEKIDAGNADTATKLATARTISLTGSVTGSGSFDGSGNLSISTTTNHTHSYLPLSGGTMAGTAFITWPDSGNWSNSNSGITFPVKRGGLQWVGQSDSIQLFSEETSNDNLNLICQFADDGSPSLIFRTTNGSQVARIGADGTMSASTFIGNLSGNAATASKVIDSVNGNPITITYAKAGQSSTSWFASWNGYELGSISTTNARTAMNAMGLVWANDFYGMAHPDGNTSVWIRTPLHGIIPYQTGGASSLGANGWSFNSAYINTVYGNLSGNASTATQLATARSINGTNFDGTVNITTANWGTYRTLTIGNTARSVNGSSDISWPNPLKIAYYGSDTANTNGWYKVGTWSQSGWSDMNLNLLVTSGYGRRAMGIIYLAVRCDNNTTNYCTALKWLCRYGFNIGDFYFKDHGNNTWSLYVQQTVAQYGRVQIQVLSETGTSASQHNLTFNSNSTKESAAPTGGTVSTDGNFIYSSTEPSGRYEGMVWLKPIS